MSGATESLPTTVDHYAVLGLLGKGAFAHVYRVKDPRSGRTLALKQLKSDKPHAMLRFRREYQTLAGLEHPAIVRAYDYGLADGRAYYTMEVVSGADFGTIVPTNQGAACGLLRDVASALALLHSRRLLHRDIAPKNVRATPAGRAKLLDFGILATFGVSQGVAGTFPCLPPEALAGLAIDQRADLFSLGALAYRLLTGVHAFPARSFGELMRQHAAAPVPPSELRSWVSPELDELVLSLLARDPRARPTNAADVMDRLSVIGALEQLPELDIARGYLRSSVFVGRAHELGVAQQLIDQSRAGRGGTLLIKGNSGSGKSTFVHEVAIRAQIGGMLVARANGRDGDQGNWGVVRALTTAMRRFAPADTEQSAEQTPPKLFHARQGSRQAATLQLAEDGREVRLMQQQKLIQWLQERARRAPLMLLVDDVHRSDEASAAMLAVISDRIASLPILLVMTHRSDEEPHVRNVVDRLTNQAGTVMSLGPLSREEVRALARSTFGEVRGSEAVAHWLHKHSGGSPMACAELLRHIVEQGHARYDGEWVLPTDLDGAGAPPGLQEAMDRVVAQLSPSARRLVQVMALWDAPLTLEQLGLLLETPIHETGGDEVMKATELLEGREVIMGSVHNWSLRHDGLRDAAIRSMDDGKRRQLQLRLGESMVGQLGEQPVMSAKVGWLLFNGGEQERGARLLGEAGRRLYLASSFRDAIGPLEASLSVKRSHHDLSEAYFMLIACGFYCDRAVGIRHGDAALDHLEAGTGLQLAGQLERYVGTTLGLWIAIVITVLSHMVTRRFQHPRRALHIYARAIVYRAGIAAFSLDRRTLLSARRRLAPLAAVRRANVRGVIVLLDMMLAFNRADRERLFALGEEMLAELARDADQPTGKQLWTDLERRSATGGALYQLAIARVPEGRALSLIERLEGLGVLNWNVGALMLRALHHAWRGEEDLVRGFLAKADVELVRVGAVWSAGAAFAASGVTAYGLFGDGLNLKRCVELLQQMVRDGMHYQAGVDLGRGELARTHGNLDEARAILLRAREAYADNGLVRFIRAALADVLVQTGEVDRGEHLAREGATETGSNLAPIRVRDGLTIAEAHSRRGDIKEARAHVDRLIAGEIGANNPVLCGLLHEGAARYAAADGDEPAFGAHLQRVADLLRPADNPALIGRYETLARRSAPRVGSQPPREHTLGTSDTLVRPNGDSSP